MKSVTTFLLILLIAGTAMAQGVAINEDNSSPDPSAMLDVKSSEKGILIPHLTQTQRNAVLNPANGLLIYQTDNEPGFYYNAGTPATPLWQLVGSNAGVFSQWGTNGSNIFYNDGNVGIGTGTPQAKIHARDLTNGGGNILFEGSFKSSNQGLPPVQGAGTRMMWYPDKAAFRVGRVINSNWDTDSIGNYSTAFGYSTKAIGWYSTAFGSGSSAAGTSSLAAGNATVASGNYSFALGANIQARSAYEIVIGRYNTEYNQSTTTGWNFSDRLFVVGNGFSASTRSDAMVILKNGNVGFGTSTPSGVLHTQGFETGQGNVLFEGQYKASPGAPPVTGAGTRMMWYPDKAALRAGRVTAGQWDINQIGNYSVAMGLNVTASGDNSAAWGSSTVASGNLSAAWGSGTVASGNQSAAWGSGTEASGNQSTAWGSGSTASGLRATAFGFQGDASGQNSTAWGANTRAASYVETAVGRFNTNYTPVNEAGWSSSDRLFVIGNGTSEANRRDAFIVFKSGQIETYSSPGKKAIQFLNTESSRDQGIINMYNHDEKRTIRLDGEFSSLAPHGHIRLYDGIDEVNYKIYLTANWGGSGKSRIVTDQVQITGGSDLAEHFDILESETVPLPGMVVSIDHNSTGKLSLANTPYDKKVAGIISGANGVDPGMVMGQAGSIADGKYPVSLTGRVYVYASEEGGEIEPGDLLTTSSRPGYAMRVSDKQRAFGAIIGKAMTTVNESGFVLVLVNLQ